MHVFKECGLFIITKVNLDVAIFLDTELDLTNDTDQPYRKPNGNPTYINTNFNQPPNIKKPILKSSSKQFSKLSSNEKVLSNKIRTY